MLNFHRNLLSALLHLKIFACNYQSDNGQTNEGTDRLTNIVTYRAAITAKNVQFFSWGWGSVTQKMFFFTYTDEQMLLVLFEGGGGCCPVWKKSLEFYSYSLITFVFLDFFFSFWCHAIVVSFLTFLGPFDYFWGMGTDQILFCMRTNFYL